MREFALTSIIQILENETCLGEALFFPEVSRFGGDPRRVRDALQANASQMTEKLPPLEMHRRHACGEPTAFNATLLLEPPPRSTAWRQPVLLTFPAIRWQHGDEMHIAFILALGIEVAAASLELLEDLIPRHIRAALLRENAATALSRLVWLQRCRELQVERLPFTASIRSPKQVAAAAGEDESAAKKSVLKKVATDLSAEALPPAYEVDDVAAYLAETLAGRTPRSVLLVGPSGVGKTAAFHEMVRRRHEFGLGRAPFWATSGSRLVAGMSGFGMWQERCRDLVREAAKLKAILHLGNLVELMEVGKSVSNTQGIASFFHPYLMRGDLLAVVECAPEQLSAIERADPHLLEAFQQIKVEEPAVEKGKTILLNYVIAASSKSGPPMELDAVETLDRLHRRYATYSAYPGRPVRFLKNLLQDRPQDRTLTPQDVTAAFSRETGLPLFLLDEAARLDLEDTRRWFAERVIGQPEAVDLIVNLLATVKAGLSRPRKPLASLLFIGPTGVGKTEMAKALAEFLFQDRGRMIRFDMSEYAHPAAVNRLVGGAFGAEGLLTARVREQPFSAVLLDEFEKADPLFFDLLLQVLGEGRLTDAGGRLADFCNSVVIMTSNLGAESFQRGGVGVLRDAADREKAGKHFVKEVRAFVRPELYNRIDRVVPFAPLDEEAIMRVAARELEKLQGRDGVKYRGVSLRITDDVRRYLAAKGYDARYGARPLKRAIERELLVPLAEGLNRRAAPANRPDHAGAAATLKAEAWMEQDSIRVAVRAQDEPARQPAAVPWSARAAQIAKDIAALRREAQALERSPAALELNNELFRLEKLLKRLESRRWKSAEETDRLNRLPDLRRAAQTIQAMAARIASLEDETLLAVYRKEPCDTARLSADLAQATKEWTELLIFVYSLRFRHADAITLAVYSENLKCLFEAAAAYYALATGAGADVTVFQFVTNDGEVEKETRKYHLLGRAVGKQRVEKREAFFASPRAGVVGIAMGIKGAMVYPRYEGERGLHALVEEKHTHRWLVDTSEAAIAEYAPPAGIERRGAIKNQPERRSYNVTEFIVKDAILKKRYPWDGSRMIEVLGAAIADKLLADARSLVVEESSADAD